MLRLSRALVLSALFLGGAACAEQRRDEPAREGAPDAGATFQAQLGSTWELTRLGDQDLPASPARPASRPGMHPGPGTRPTIRFTLKSAAEMSGVAGTRQAGGWSFCNGYGMAYSVGPGDQLTFQHFQSTLVGCGGPDSPESRYFRALAGTRRFQMTANTLALIAADGTRLVFTPAPESVRDSTAL